MCNQRPLQALTRQGQIVLIGTKLCLHVQYGLCALGQKLSVEASCVIQVQHKDVIVNALDGSGVSLGTVDDMTPSPGYCLFTYHCTGH